MHLQVQQLRSNPEVMQYINRPLTQTLEEAETWVNMIINALAKNDGITWCICMKDSPGNAYRQHWVLAAGKRKLQGRDRLYAGTQITWPGFMYEAIQAVLHYGFEQLGLHSVEAQIDPRNGASAALLKKAGFIQEGYFRENYFLRDRFADTAVYSLLKRDALQNATMATTAAVRAKT
jgi:ribosomal-protein-alanine N-acetyltransferase